ncbi:hypothetical protein ACFT7S_04015 [Streptomyces sp. NPDC057136]|uniref:hypothetical protein n=1 Tax=Streptomyces sp. NPDC057136 TaxID=3346029 RepID=UPI00363756EA
MAQYRLWREFTEDGGPPFIPIKPFEMRSNHTATSFTKSVMFDVAHAFIEHRRVLKEHGYNFPGSDRVEEWLSNPMNRSRAVGATVMGVGATFSGGRTSNTSQGFTDHGFPGHVLAWLEECFPEPASGGFICTIDNLELLRTAKASINALESMRDSVFSYPGLLWILCGANHVTRTLVQTPRLRGRLNDPIEVPAISEGQVGEVIERRLQVYALGNSSDAPVDSDNFQFIYAVIGKHLRDAFKYAECFSAWLQRQHPDASRNERNVILRSWLVNKGRDHENSQGVQLRVKERAWRLFDSLASAGGYCIYSQHMEFNFQNTESMRQQMVRLSDVGLVRQDTDVAARGRNVMSLTPIGWLVARARGVVADPA